ncbi:MAG: SGNH/GDSL hydrolase family protein [Anaerolineae bacterium]|nr:SGNH/GDSL hydrolase family protein [Anaerolineae bacterium]
MSFIVLAHPRRLIGILLICASGILTGCNTQQGFMTQKEVSAAELPLQTGITATIDVGPTGEFVETAEVLVTSTPRPTPIFWQEMPVIPIISNRARQIYQEGLDLGNNPNAFSKVGDCESRTTWFLSDFDLGPQYYSLGEYEHLYQVIENYRGSFNRLSMVAKPGFNAASVMVPLWADKEQCLKNEHPLACEYRIHRPSIAFIMLGTNDVYRIESFEDNLRKVIEYSIDAGVVPILTTKADNLEGDHYINAVIAELAYEYDVPLWNFWAAVQSLPNHGLQEDRAHLTWTPNNFSDPKTMLRAWPVRNLTALQVLEAFWEAVSR